tara:strand:+ start:92 stop:787 length:696 start_codon:yes stop_codon:yes gene_type:complete
LEIRNSSKRLITSIVGIFVIVLGFEFLPTISFIKFLGFTIHPLVLTALILFFLEIIKQLINNLKSRNYKFYLFILIYIIFFIHVIAIENMTENWKLYFFFVLFQVFSVDSFGYIFGKLFGKSKLSFLVKISPNKTIEGYIGSVIFGFLFGFFILYFLSKNYLDDIGIFIIFITSIGIVITSILGDLAVSKIKRILSIDDFSNIFYGHGGILDRLDSILPSFTFFFWIFFLT